MKKKHLGRKVVHGDLQASGERKRSKDMVQPHFGHWATGSMEQLLVLVVTGSNSLILIFAARVSASSCWRAVRRERQVGPKKP